MSIVSYGLGLVAPTGVGPVVQFIDGVEIMEDIEVAIQAPVEVALIIPIEVELVDLIEVEVD